MTDHAHPPDSEHSGHSQHSKDDVLLVQIVLMFQTAAMSQLGKLKNPATGTIDRDLQQASMSIDILDFLFRKMEPSLSADQRRWFSDVLRDLRLNYLDEAAKSPDPAAPAPAPPPAKGETGKSAT
jgi:hypothetical protein